MVLVSVTLSFLWSRVVSPASNSQPGGPGSHSLSGLYYSKPWWAVYYCSLRSRCNWGGEARKSEGGKEVREVMGGAGMEQWWEHLSRISVAQVQFPVSASYVGWVVGSRPCSERFFSGYSCFPLSSKTNISKFQFNLDHCQGLYHEPLTWEIAQALPVSLTLNLIWLKYPLSRLTFSPSPPQLCLLCSLALYVWVTYCTKFTAQWLSLPKSLRLSRLHHTTVQAYKRQLTRTLREQSISTDWFLVERLLSFIGFLWWFGLPLFWLCFFLNTWLNKKEKQSNLMKHLKILVPDSWNLPKQASKQASKEARKQGSKEARKQGSKEARKQGSKEASRQGSKQASKQASKQVSKQASKEASKEAGKQGSKEASKQARKQANK